MTIPEQRLCLPSLGDLLDRLAISQIKEIKYPNDALAFARDMERTAHDIDLIIKESDVALSADLIRIVVALAQLNVHIWNYKDDMQTCLPDRPERYDVLLKTAHQLNGLRNQLKNRLLEIIGERDPAERKSNFDTDGLMGWKLSILKGLDDAQR